MFNFTLLLWIEIEEMYTVYCMECDKKETDPKNRKEWYNDIFRANSN